MRPRSASPASSGLRNDDPQTRRRADIRARQQSGVADRGFARPRLPGGDCAGSLQQGRCLRACPGEGSGYPHARRQPQRLSKPGGLRRRHYRRAQGSARRPRLQCRLHAATFGVFRAGVVRAATDIHRSLLPAFRGLHPQARALEAGVRVSGATVHFVSEEMDAGPIIAQGVAPVEADDTEETLRPASLRWSTGFTRWL